MARSCAIRVNASLTDYRQSRGPACRMSRPESAPQLLEIWQKLEEYRSRKNRDDIADRQRRLLPLDGKPRGLGAEAEQRQQLAPMLDRDHDARHQRNHLQEAVHVLF